MIKFSSLFESPFEDKSNSKSFYEKNSKNLRDEINKRHDSSEKIEGALFKNDLNNKTVYYEKRGETVGDFSIVNGNSFDWVHKSSENNSNIKKFIDHHLEKTGEVKVGDSNTKGAIHLLNDYLKGKPKETHKIFVKTEEGEKETNALDLLKNKDLYWGEDKEHVQIFLRKYDKI